MDSRWLDRENLLSPVGHRMAINQLIVKLMWNMASGKEIHWCLRDDGSFYFGTNLHGEEAPMVLSNPCQRGVPDPGQRVSLMKFYSHWRNSTQSLCAFGVIPALVIRRFFKTKSFRGHRRFTKALCANEHFHHYDFQ